VARAALLGRLTWRVAIVTVARITLPLLILHGTEDKAAKSSGSQLFYDRAGSTDKTLKLYDGHFYDLLNDLGKETVMTDITTWIEARLPGGAKSGADH